MNVNISNGIKYDTNNIEFPHKKTLKRFLFSVSTVHSPRLQSLCHLIGGNYRVSQSKLSVKCFFLFDLFEEFF